MTRLFLAATALGALTGLAFTFGAGGAVGVAVCAGVVIAWFGVRAVRADRRRERDKARHPSLWTPPGGLRPGTIIFDWQLRPGTIIFDWQPRDRSGMDCERCGSSQLFRHKCVDGQWVRGAIDGLVG